MLFKRRTRQTLGNKIGNLLWPKMGFRRVLYYYKHRSIRIPAGEYAIAAGLAIGVAVSWTPTFGFHMAQCALIAWMLRANILAALLGSSFGNPWTFPFIMFVSYHVGRYMFEAAGYGDMVFHHDGPITLELLKQQKMKVFLPTLVGGYTVGILTFPFFYYPFYYMVKAARAARKLRIQRKVHHEIAEATGQQD